MIPYMVREGYSSIICNRPLRLPAAWYHHSSSILFRDLWYCNKQQYRHLFIVGFGPGIMIGIALIVVSRFICKNAVILAQSASLRGKRSFRHGQRGKMGL